MYFPVGWPKVMNFAFPGENGRINHICCDTVKILVAAVGDNFLGIWYSNPLIPIVIYRRSADSVSNYGTNKFIIWKPDSRKLAILTNSGVLLLYQIDFDPNGCGILTQIDPPSNLKRDSAELFIKENIPRLSLVELGPISCLDANVKTVCCNSLTELLIATADCELIRIKWDDLEVDVEYEGAGRKGCNVINLRSIPFYVNQNCHLKSLPPIAADSYVSALEYSPFIGGCAIVFSDRRAAFIIAMHLRFETQNMHGFWVPDVEDATVCSVNHKFRLLAYGRHNSDVTVYGIEDATGGLEFSHRLSLNNSVIPAALGAVTELKWSPDGCVLAAAWQNGGISLWSTFGTLLMSSLSWEFGLHVDLMHNNPLKINKLEWSAEGYQIFMVCAEGQCQNQNESTAVGNSNVLQLNFVKSTLAMNPCMASHSHILLQGDDTLYLNQGDNLEKIYFGSKFIFPNTQGEASQTRHDTGDSWEIKKAVDTLNILSESKYWSVIQLPQTYACTNWPIRYSAVDADGLYLAVAGRTGLAHYSMLTKKWKLFGNETQEKDFVVSGGLLWWHTFIVLGCYSLVDRTDEIRCYPSECKLDNRFGSKIQVCAPVISLNIFRDQLIALTADGIVSLFQLKIAGPNVLNVECSYEVDVKSICIHPACIVSLTITNLRNDITSKNTPSGTSSELAETIIVNVCGRILMIQRDTHNNVINSLMASCLASCVECFWSSNEVEKGPMRDCLWLYSGAQGMRVWLPILPPSNEQVRNDAQRLHTFMSKRIMLSFNLKLYPLVILFDNVIVLGVENETTLFTSEAHSHFALPFCVLERKSQVYLHKILRQLIKRNLGYNAWEIAKSCRALPYFPHSLELLLHEVLEEEATSKEPIPDALLPSVLDFIREFPVYLQTIVQCARKTEIALWPYLFSMAGKPKDLFQMCLQSEELETAASYLIILQNLEPSVISKQYATLLLDVALQKCKWELAKDLIRFLKAIDPNEIDSPRSSMIINTKIAPPSQSQSQVNQNPEVFNLILGPIARDRTYSTTVVSNLPKEKKEKSSTVIAPSVTGSATSGVTSNEVALNSSMSNNAATQVRRRCSTKERKEMFSIDTIIQKHARKLLQKCKLIELGYMSAYLDFHMVTWLSQEADGLARLDDFVETLICLHDELKLPAPFLQGTDTHASHLSQLHRQFMLDNPKNHPYTSSQTSESGYFSLALMDTPTSMNNGNIGQSHMPAIKRHDKLLNHVPNTDAPSQIAPFDHARYNRIFSINDDVPQFGLAFDCIGSAAETNLRILPEKLSIKIRYMLQLCIEANCTDYALVLSILLHDAASIGRILNVVIRSDTVATCKRIDNALKHLTQWSNDRNCLYHSFISSLQPHIYILDEYIRSKSAAAVAAATNMSSYRQSDISENCEFDDVDDHHNVNRSNYIQSEHMTSTDPKSWALGDTQRLNRQASFSSTGLPSSNTDKNALKDNHPKRNEPSSCRVM